jgi:hypothetical protein
MPDSDPQDLLLRCWLIWLFTFEGVGPVGASMLG